MIMKEKIKENKWILLILMIFTIIIISMIIYIINNKTEDSIPPDQLDKIYVGYDKKEPIGNFSREDSVEALRTLLLDVKIDIDSKNRTVDERLKLFNDADTDMADVISEKVINKIYFAEDFGQDKYNRQFAGSALLAYYKIIDSSNSSGNFNPQMQEYDELIYLDNKLMTSHIPLDIFVGKATGIAFEMQYIDNEWKLNPYTSMMSLKLMGILDTNSK